MSSLKAFGQLGCCSWLISIVFSCEMNYPAAPSQKVGQNRSHHAVPPNGALTPITTTSGPPLGYPPEAVEVRKPTRTGVPVMTDGSGMRWAAWKTIMTARSRPSSRVTRPGMALDYAAPRKPHHRAARIAGAAM